MEIKNVEAIKTYLKTLPIVVAYVFGSQVNGNTHNQSDLDLAIVLEKDFTPDMQFISQVESHLQKLIPDIEVQLTVITPETKAPLFLGKVIQGIPLVVKNQHSKDEFHVETFRKYRDAKHLLNISHKYFIERTLGT